MHCSIPVNVQGYQPGEPRYGVHGGGELSWEGMETPVGASLWRQGSPVFLGDLVPTQQILDNLVDDSVGPNRLPQQPRLLQGVLGDHGSPGGGVSRSAASPGPTRLGLGDIPIMQA